MSSWQTVQFVCVLASCAVASLLRDPEIARSLYLGPPRMIAPEIRLMNRCALRGPVHAVCSTIASPPDFSPVRGTEFGKGITSAAHA